jgi:hypothetical protein
VVLLFPLSSSTTKKSKQFIRPFASLHHPHLTIATMNNMNNNNNMNNMNNNNNMNNAGKEDYLDKALDKFEQMAGKKVCAQMSQSHTQKRGQQN